VDAGTTLASLGIQPFVELCGVERDGAAWAEPPVRQPVVLDPSITPGAVGCRRESEPPERRKPLDRAAFVHALERT